MNIFNVTAKSALVSELLGYFRKVQGDLQQLKGARRKPIFIILDKVTKFWFHRVFHVFNTSNALAGNSATSLGEYDSISDNTNFSPAIATFLKLPVTKTFYEAVQETCATSEN